MNSEHDMVKECKFALEFTSEALLFDLVDSISCQGGGVSLEEQASEV